MCFVLTLLHSQFPLLDKWSNWLFGWLIKKDFALHTLFLLFCSSDWCSLLCRTSWRSPPRLKSSDWWRPANRYNTLVHQPLLTSGLQTHFLWAVTEILRMFFWTVDIWQSLMLAKQHITLIVWKLQAGLMPVFSLFSSKVKTGWRRKANLLCLA